MSRGEYECGQCGGVLAERPWWCPSCYAFLTIQPRISRPVAFAIAAADLRPASDLYHAKGRWLADVPDELRQVFGRLPSDMPYLALISGPAGAGKTYLALKLADYLAQASPVCYYLVEETAPAAIGEKLRELEIANSALLIGACSDLGVMRDQIRDAGAVAVFLDSISYLTLTGRDLSGLVLDLGVPVFGIQHVTKEGEPRGPADLAHACDLHVHLPARGKYEIRKSRFAPTTEGVMA